MDFQGQQVSIADVRRYFEDVPKAPTLDEYEGDRWTAEMVDPSVLRVCHDDFRSEPLQKGVLFPRVVEANRDRILSGDFPESVAIVAGPTGDVPALVVLRDRKGGLYVFDGSLRTLQAVWNGQGSLAAFVFEDGSDRAAL